LFPLTPEAGANRRPVVCLAAESEPAAIVSQLEVNTMQFQE